MEQDTKYAEMDLQDQVEFPNLRVSTSIDAVDENHSTREMQISTTAEVKRPDLDQPARRDEGPRTGPVIGSSATQTSSHGRSASYVDG